MNCVICKFGNLHDGSTTVTLQRDESTIIIKDVPARVCDNCGEYYLSDEVTARVTAMAEDAYKHHSEVEILQFAA